MRGTSETLKQEGQLKITEGKRKPHRNKVALGSADGQKQVAGWED